MRAATVTCLTALVARKLGMTVEREVEYYGYRTQVWVSPAPEPLR